MSIMRSEKKIPAALLAIFVGAFGIHKFFLGKRSAGALMLFLTLIGIVGSCLGLHFLVGVMGFIGFVEGIIYLVKSDGDFYYDYIVGKKEWF